MAHTCRMRVTGGPGYCERLLAKSEALRSIAEERQSDAPTPLDHTASASRDEVRAKEGPRGLIFDTTWPSRSE